MKPKNPLSAAPKPPKDSSTSGQRKDRRGSIAKEPSNSCVGITELARDPREEMIRMMGAAAVPLDLSESSREEPKESSIKTGGRSKNKRGTNQKNLTNTCVGVTDMARDPREEMIDKSDGNREGGNAHKVKKERKPKPKLSSPCPVRINGQTKPTPTQLAHIANYELEDVDIEAERSEEDEHGTHPNKMVTKPSSKKKNNRVSTFDVTSTRATLLNQMNHVHQMNASRDFDYNHETLAEEEEEEEEKVEVWGVDRNSIIYNARSAAVDKRSKSRGNASTSSNRNRISDISPDLRAQFESSMDECNAALGEEEENDFVCGIVRDSSVYGARTIPFDNRGKSHSNALTNNSKYNMSNSKRVSGNNSHSSNSVKSSLRKCLEEMGFNIDSIDVAIESCSASSFDDGARVVAWLQEHGDELTASGICVDNEGGHSRVSTGGIPSATKKEMAQARSLSEPVVSTREVEKLSESLSDMGFSKKEIAKSVKVFKKIPDCRGNAEDYISAMLESGLPDVDDDTTTNASSVKSGGAEGAVGSSGSVNDTGMFKSLRNSGMEMLVENIFSDAEQFRCKSEAGHNGGDESRGGRGDGRAMSESSGHSGNPKHSLSSSARTNGRVGSGSGNGSAIATGVHMKYRSSDVSLLVDNAFNNSELSASASKAKVDSGLNSALSQMGFNEVQIARAVADLKKSGMTKPNADDVLSVLLGDSSHGTSNKNITPSPQKSSSRNKRSQLESQRISYSQSQPKVIPESTTGGVHKGQAEDDQLMIEISPGKFEPILPGRRTWSAMHAGTSISVDCIVCNTTLQCCPEAEYVLCPDCNVVSSLCGDPRRRVASSVVDRKEPTNGSYQRLSADDPPRGVGLGFKQKETV